MQIKYVKRVLCAILRNWFRCQIQFLIHSQLTLFPYKIPTTQKNEGTYIIHKVHNMIVKEKLTTRSSWYGGDEFHNICCSAPCKILIEFISVLSRVERSTADAMMFPGTNWCGRGARVNGYSHLGTYSGADKCCRQHDLGCPYFISSGDTKYGVYNWKLYTMSHCTCDER